MAIEASVFKSERDLKGFRLSPNVTADKLEISLGIVFPVRPAAVILTGRNRFVYAVKTGIISSALAAVLSRGRGDAIGKYDYRYHAYFADEETDLFTGLHENMHGFNALTNPDIPQQLDVLSKAVSNRLTSRPTGAVDIEKAVALRSFDEGMAQWAAIEAASTLEEFDPEDMNKLRNLMLRDKKVKGEVIVDDEFIAREFGKLRQGIDTYNEALGLTGIKVMTVGAKAEGLMRDAQYTAGFYFVYHAAKELMGSGMDTAETITALVANPPTLLQQLRQLQDFGCGTVRA